MSDRGTKIKFALIVAAAWLMAAVMVYIFLLKFRIMSK